MTRSLDQYEVLFWVSKCRSFSEAAGLLNRSRTTLLRSINNFEENLGFKVLNRSNEGISLTPAGERMVDVYRGVRMALSKIEHPDKPNTREQRFQITVAVTDLKLANALYPSLNLHYNNATCSPTLTICEDATAIAQVASGVFDIAFVMASDTENIKEKITLPIVAHPIQTQDAQTCYAILDCRLSSLGKFEKLISQVRLMNHTGN